MPKKEENRFWNIPVPAELDDVVEKLVKEGAYITKADAIRAGIRKIAEERGTKP